jgi:hypothetical protein
MEARTDSLEIARRVLEACRNQDYAGYGKFDALNSPILEKLSFDFWPLRLLFTQAVKECPFHIRPLLGVQKSRNPKGVALFARAYMHLYELLGDQSLLIEAEKLLTWLIDNPSPGEDRMCWGYNFAWQSQIFYLKKYQPNAVVTVFVCESLIHAFRLTQKQRYLDAALAGGSFLRDGLAVMYEEGEERAVSYVKAKASRVVLNTQVLTGAVFVKLFKITGDTRWLSVARRQYNFTANRRIKECTWNYSYPAERYHAVDNYHTGGILDALLEFGEETGDSCFENHFWAGLEYYRDHLFEPNGAPKWMDNKPYPYDIHGAAQGIISFVKASYYQPRYLEDALRVYEWTVDNMFDPQRHEFIYRIGRYVRWNYTLMRWCNGWMTRACAELAKRQAHRIVREEANDRQNACVR